MNPPESGKLNIVFAGRYNRSENLSGPEKAAKRLFSEHSKQHKTSFIQYFFDGNVYGLGKKLFGIQTGRINENAEIFTLGIFKIYGVLKKIKPQIIHIITFERFAIAVLFYRLMNKVKIVYNSHGIIRYEDSKLKKLTFWHKLKDKICEKRFLKKTDKIIFTSEESIDIAETYYNIDESKSVILPNGIDEVFGTNAYSGTNQVLKIVFIYKNELNKSGLDFLTGAIKDFKQPAEIFIVTNEKISLPENNRVKFHSVKPMESKKLAEFYKDKDVFLSVNSYDTFSISTAEAMASGLIPVITVQTGISRYIDSSHNGFIVNYDDINGLRSIISKIIEMSQEQKKSLSQNARKIYDALSWQNVYEMYYNIYKQMTS